MVWIWLFLVLALIAAVALVARRAKLTEERLHRLEARLSAVLEGPEAGLAIWGPDARLAGCNQRFREFYPNVELKPGLVFEDLIRFTATRGLVQLDEARVEEWIAERLAQFGQVWHDELRTPDGRWLEIDTRPTQTGEVILMYADTTATRETEASLSNRSERLERQSADLELLAEAIRVGSAAESPESAIGEIVALVCQWSGWPVGYAYGVTGKGDDRVLEPIPAWHAEEGSGERFSEIERLVGHYRPGRGEGAAGRALFTGRLAVIPNVAVDPAIQPDQRAVMGEIRGACAVPVTCQGEVVAVLEFLATEQLFPDPSTARLLEAASEALAWVFHRTSPVAGIESD